MLLRSIKGSRIFFKYIAFILEGKVGKRDFCFKIVPEGSPEMWVTHFQYTLCKIPKEDRSPNNFFCPTS